jgi:hypothetical protein
MSANELVGRVTNVAIKESIAVEKNLIFIIPDLFYLRITYININTITAKIAKETMAVI